MNIFGLLLPSPLVVGTSKCTQHSGGRRLYEIWLQDPLGPAAVPGEFPGGCATEAMVGDIDWQSGGLQIIDTGDSTHLVRAGFFVPDPPASVANEDPALSEVLCSGAIPLLRTD